MSTNSDATWFVWRTGGGLFGRNKQWSDYYVQLRNGHGRQDTFWCASEDDANRLAAKLNADHNAAAAARKCKHEVATQRFHFYQEGNPAMSWWCSNCGALFLHDEVKLPALDEVTK